MLDGFRDGREVTTPEATTGLKVHSPRREFRSEATHDPAKMWCVSTVVWLGGDHGGAVAKSVAGLGECVCVAHCVCPLVWCPQVHPTTASHLFCAPRQGGM